MIAALLLLATTAAPDPRVELVELQLERRWDAALGRVEQLIAERPELAAPLGLHFLRGELLAAAGRQRQAGEAFAEALGATPQLAPYSRFRLAQSQDREGHPEVAAGLLATLLAGDTPQPLIAPATDLLVQTIDRGGDCRLLAGRRSWQLPRPQSRRLELAAADCAAAGGDTTTARAVLAGVLQADAEDDAAWEAAARLLGAEPAPQPLLGLRVGLTLHQHRDFDRSSRLLSEALARLSEAEQAATTLLDEARYALARNRFWLGDYEAAAEAFGAIAGLSNPAEKVARALYQQGRSRELAGSWSLASASYRQAYLADPDGRWAPAALVSTLRIEWRSGAETPALEAYRVLAANRSWRGMTARAALFMAASDIVRGQTDRAAAWLDEAARHSRTPRVEVAFWRGRLSHRRGETEHAVAHFLHALRADPFHPLARQAGLWLEREELAAEAGARARRQATSPDPRLLLEAWLALGDGDPAGAAARRALEARFERDPRFRGFLEARLVPPGDWPLWRARLNQPEELLLALGIWQLGSPVVLKHFPVSDVSLAYTGSRLLAASGRVRDSLYVAEIVARRLPDPTAIGLLPSGLRRLLHPFPYRSQITREADRRDVDPYLLAAIVREESRFDPEAISGAAARGLTQFTLPTARRLAATVELPDLRAEDLHRPELSIALGAAYLAELAELFDGREELMVAAYNAGEPQAQLWRSYCYSDDPAEFFTKVGFPQTRGYLAKVLASRAQYTELYGAAGP